MKAKKANLVVTMVALCICIQGCANTGESQIEGASIIEEVTELDDNSLTAYFDTYEELKAWFVLDEEGQAPAMEEMDEYGEAYEKFIEDMLSGEIQLVIPYLEDEPMRLINERVGFNGLVLSKSTGHRPSIWYFCGIEDMRFRIQIVYLSEEEVAYAKEHTINEAIQYIFTTQPNPDKLQEYVEDIQLSDRTVSALCAEYYSDERIYKHFIYDNLYVTIVGYEEVFEESIWANCSFRSYELEFEVDVPDEELTLLQKVMLNKAEYYGRTGVYMDDLGWHKITELQYFDYANKYNEFGVCDLDGDGSQEVYLYYSGGDVLILHEEDGVVYGYSDVFRGFNNLCTNGIFAGSSGTSDNYWCGNVSFDKSVMKHDYIHIVDEYNPVRIVYSKGTAINDESGWHYQDEVEITETEWNEIAAQNPRGERVEEYPFTAENVMKYVK